MTSAASPVNGANVNGPPNLPSSTAARTQLKMTTSNKSTDSSRKQSASPVDGPQRKPTQKAWTQGNPITQRSNNSNNSNGVADIPKSGQATQNSAMSTVETASPMKHLNDRMLYLLATFVGLPGNITLKNGEKYTGVLSGTSLDPSEMRYVFKMVKRVPGPGDASINGASEVTDDYIGSGDHHVLSFNIGDVADFHVANVVLDKTVAKAANGVSSSFRTDTDISGNLAIRERNLQRWEPSSDVNANLSLETSGRSTEWDQFRANEQMFGVTSNYDENIYTTTIDRTNPQYAERAARAERIAREIEAGSALNAHVAEERGLIAPDDKGIDEEEKYSGVRRDFPPLPTGQPNKYTPPARRPPTNQPTVPGAPVDPAIISSHISRPVPPAPVPLPSSISPRTEKPQSPKVAVLPEAVQRTEAAIPTKPPVPQETPKETVPEVAKDATTKSELNTAPPKSVEQNQKPSAAFKGGVTGLHPRRPGRPDNATANVEHDVLDHFKQFSAGEKLRMAERQRNMARESKAVKLNDLRKFSQNFKLHTPVPQDLVPILAKDENKQKEIVDKALRAVQEVNSTPPKPAPAPTPAPAAAPVDPKAIRTGNVKSGAIQGSPNNAPGERQNAQRQRSGQNHFSSARNERPGQNPNLGQVSARNGPGLLSTRLALNQQQHKAAGAVPYHNIPHPIPPIQDLRIPPPTGPSAPSSGVQTPASAVSTRFNVRAPDFKPNPAANTFLPGGNNPSAGSSPRPDSASKSEPRKPPKTSFFGARTPTSQARPPPDAFNPIARMSKEAEKENKTREYSSNGGIPQAYRTPPTWDVPELNKERSHIDMFERGTMPQPTAAPQNNNGPMSHHSQVPAHLQPVGPQVVSQTQTPHHTPRHPPAQPHHGQGQHHFDGHHMQFSQSASSVHPSPRPMPPYLYPTNAPQGMPVYPQQPPMHSYGMSPNVQHVPMRQQGGPQFVTGPAPGMGGQMMTHQHSNGPFMAMPTNPPMAMYSPAPNPPAFTHYTTQMPLPPGSNGFPSPRAVGAQMMTHQGSQQGHQPQPIMYGQHGGGQVQPMFAHIPTAPMTPMRGPYAQPHQPHYGSPHQHHAYPQQPHRGTPSGSYTQPMMHPSLQPQVALPPGPVNHGPEGGEEVK